MDLSPQAAFDWIKGKLNDFYAKGDTLQSQEQALNSLIAAYVANNMDATDLYTLMGEVNDELLAWQSISNKLTPLLGYFGYTPPSLGLDPLTLVAIGSSLLAVYSLLWAWYNSQKIDAHSDAIKLLASHVPLSPTDQAVIDQATTPTGFWPSIFGGLGTIGNYLLIGGALYLAILWSRK